VGYCWETDKYLYLSNGRYTLIEMTLDNSPAYMPGKWDGTKFINLREEKTKD
jgi:hypothetical protein